jgi:hypothetical protein
LVVVRTAGTLRHFRACCIEPNQRLSESKLLPFLYRGDRAGEAELGDLLDEAVRLELGRAMEVVCAKIVVDSAIA